MLTAVRVAFAWMTILPTRSPIPNRREAGRAMAALPAVGLCLGLFATALGHLFLRLGAGPLLAGLGAIAALLVLTRGMHIDALADTVDGLGSYSPPKRAREIMASGSVGPMGVAAIVVVIALEAAAVGQLLSSGAWVAPVAAITLSRCLPTFQLAPTVPPASNTGFGALVAGSASLVQRWVMAILAVACGALLGVAGLAAPSWWAALTGALLGAALACGSVAFARHAVRRLGGISGDVLGATIEVGAATALVAAVLLV